ncbi:MAG: hypothetical protein IJQ93_10380 [Bacteroidales bacterium]|nr:hypothetical protein [Bacteroidales bacterium]
MKLRVKIFSVLLVFGWQVTTFGPVCQASTSNRLDYSKIDNLQHPRLLMFEEDFERLRSRVMGNEKEKYAALLKAHSLATGLADSEIENQSNYVCNPNEERPHGRP